MQSPISVTKFLSDDSEQSTEKIKNETDGKSERLGIEDSRPIIEVPDDDDNN